MDTVIVHRYVNGISSSNTYLVISGKSVFIIDPGDVGSLSEYVSDNDFNLLGVFLTHTHYDHIYGLNDILTEFGDVPVYTTEYGSTALFSERLNLSLYMGGNFIFSGENIVNVDGIEFIGIAADLTIKVIHTPGHSPDSVSYMFGNYFFTGDAYIPGLPVVTILRGGNRKFAESSVERIRKMSDENTIICPGHGDIVKYIDLNQD